MRGYVDTSAGQVHYRRAGGAGPDIVLVHCANFSSSLYEHALPLLGSRLRAWAFDAPGVAWSDGPPQPGITRVAGWLLEAMDGLGIGNAVIAGQYTGSRIALEMVRLRGLASFPALILTGVGPLDAPASPEAGEGLSIGPDREGSQWRRAVAGYRRLFPSQDPPAEEDAWIQHRFAFSVMGQVVPSRLPWPGHAGEPAPGPAFRDFPAPILLLRAPEDLLAEADREAARQNPRAELRVIRGAGPHLMLRQPGLYAGEIIRFLERRGVLAAPPAA